MMTMVYDYNNKSSKPECGLSCKTSNSLGTWRWQTVRSFGIQQSFVCNIYLLRTKGIEAIIRRKHLPIPVKVDVVSVAVACTGTDHL